MLYFLYNPIQMNELEALAKAIRHLDSKHVVYIKPKGVQLIPLRKGAVAKALPETYLVRVEPDYSTRVVQKGKDVS